MISKRSKIRKQFLTAWNDVITNEYVNREISNERDLQAALCEKLKIIFENSNTPNRKVFLEPTIFFKGKKSIPDMIICNSNSVIAVIELKFTPRAHMDKQGGKIGDLVNLRKMFSKSITGDKPYFTVDRYNGPSAEIKYSLSNDIQCIWAGIHVKYQDRLKLPYIEEETIGEFEQNLLEVHTETRDVSDENGNPTSCTVSYQSGVPAKITELH